MTNDLPQPEPDALAHSQALQVHIRRTIREAGGRIGFARYMEMALYAPAQGYYSAGTAKFGGAGDFTTAPEVSPLFGATWAAGIGPTLKALGDESVLLEMGAGTGALAVALLRQLDADGALPGEYWILEVSADLKERQRATIAALDADLRDRVRWLDALPQRPFRGVVVANEVLDALPVERFRVNADGSVHSAWVGLDDDTPVLEYDRAPPELRVDLDAIVAQCAAAGVPLPPGYCSEFCPGVRGFMFTLAYCLEQGLLVLADYGGTRREVYLPERADGTLRCHYRHRAHDDAFFLPGLQDITAWVDFTAVADAAIDADLTLAGYTTQAHYLLASGFDRVLGEHFQREPERLPMLQSEAKTLTLPGEMGERFKFIGLSKNFDGPVGGFDFRDLAATLAMHT
ncbi:MAG: class I SAM-dependent methyltransferase [Gammaproteobacteria bacterium]